jgi:hypothetical protein
MNHKDRAIKQIEEFYAKNDDVIIWEDVTNDFIEEKSKGEIMRKYGFTLFQYKALKQFILKR